MAHEGFGAALLEDLHGDRPRVEIIGNSRVVVETTAAYRNMTTACCVSNAAGARCASQGRGWRLLPSRSTSWR